MTAEHTSSHPRRVLHALSISWPYLNGYTVRSRGLIEAQAASGKWLPFVVTSPYYPDNPAAIRDCELNNIQYLRVPHPTNSEGLGRPSDALAAGLHGLGRAAAATGRRIERRADHTDVTDHGGTRDNSNIAHSTKIESRRRTGVSSAVLGALWDARQAPRERLQDLESTLLMARFKRKLTAIARAEKPALVHAHSPFRVGLPAIAAARKIGAPVVYEVRGLWEESAVSSGDFRRGDRRYRSWRTAEDRAMREADAVVCICESLKQEMLSRGIPERKLFVVPNAVGSDVLSFASAAKNKAPEDSPRLAEVRARLRPFVLGYIGSVRRMEGIAELVRAGAQMVRRGCDISVLVVGGGDIAPLKQLAEDLNVEGRTVFTGEIEHAQIAGFYSLIDAFVISRPDEPVTRTVTPLKPLEAMALGRALIVSDLPALREIVTDGETGLVYPAGNPTALAHAGQQLLDDPDYRYRLADHGREWVTAHRTWAAIVNGYDKVYASVGA